MPVAERDGERIVLQTEFREKELIKQIPGVRWSTEEGLWWIPLSWAGCMQLRGVFHDTLQVGVGLGAWAVAERANRIDPCLAVRDAEDSEAMSFYTALHPFQRAGVQFLVTARQALLADEMGLGKTVQAIAALEALGDAAYPALIVCPNSMKLTWALEFNKWAPKRIPVVVSGGAAARRKQIDEVARGEADVAIINYEGLRYHTRLAGYGQVALTDDEKVPKELNAIAFKSVVADEAHRAKDPHAKQTRALWAVGAPAEQRFALSGTPIANSPEDIWTLMRFVAPVEFPAKTKFITRYAMQEYNVFGFQEISGLRSENRDELFRILDPRFIRRTKATVLTQLPPKTYATRVVELSAKQRKAYESIRKEMMVELKGGTLLATNPLTKLTRLLQFASAHGELEPDGVDDNGVPKFKLVLTEPSCKVDALEDIVGEIGDQQAVVFAESRQLIEIAAKRLVKAGHKIGQVTGAVAARDRQVAVDDFQAGRIKILLLTLGAGGEGLTLTAASTGIFLQRSWNAVANLQAEDRMHRIGQEKAVEVIDIIAHNTVEAHVHSARASKAVDAEAICRDAETLKKWLAK